MDEPIYLALGTNLGDRQANLERAIHALPPTTEIIKQSSIYVTPPWGYESQPEFLNQVIEIRTNLSPLRLLHYLKNIETILGRLESFRNGPRLIDLDILFYGQRVIEEDALQIPHPRLQSRAFVLVPLAEIAPGLIHPVLNESVQSLLTKVDTEGVRPL
jgi:2-amino-4-hydroxy-6-hydroxymethyldihydropteridine diphosphokinase